MSAVETAASMREMAADLIKFAASDVGEALDTKGHARGVSARTKAAAQATRLLRRAAALEAAESRPAKALPRAAAPRADRPPTLAQVHKRDGVPTERARLEREVWSATHRDYRGYNPERGHEVLAAGGLVALRSVDDGALAALHARLVRRGGEG